MAAAGAGGGPGHANRTGGAGPAGAGAGAGLQDGRLGELAGHPGIGRLRGLGSAGPLAGGVRGPAGRGPDARAGLRAAAGRQRRGAGARAGRGAGRGRAGPPAGADLGELAAAAAVTDRTIALLTILGPAAASADPALPLRLAHHAPRLPALPARQLRLLAEAARPGTAARPASAGGQRHAPGTAGIGRHGSLTQLLPTQLALPADLLTARYLQNHLLYRRHTARIPPAPEPVTLILDTTPPTYGPAENILRLAAHLITTLLWESGQHPVLITLARPQAATPLTTRAHLAQLWTTRTLDPPAPALHTALDTARATGRHTVLLTHHHTPAQHYPPTPAHRLLTTHHPAEPPPPPPTRPGHYHLPPDPTPAQLTHTIHALTTTHHP